MLYYDENKNGKKEKKDEHQKPTKKFVFFEEKMAVIELELNLCGYFVIVTAEKMTAKEALELLRTIGRRAGVTRVYPHRFRRTLACRLINRSVPLQEVMKILGHEKIDTTMLYCNIDDCNVRLSHKKYA